MGLINYIFGSNQEKIDVKDEIKTKPVLITDLNKCKCKKENFYIVTNKASETILGVYNDLEKAKKDGQKLSYHNCSIAQYKLNTCNHLTNVIFENK